MDATIWKRVQELFAEAVDVPTTEREAWLDRRCAGESETRTHLERLLAADDVSSLWLRPGQSMEDVLEPVAAGLQTGTHIGGYVLREPIATGGMGTVWCAEQAQPHRLVALKTLRADLSTADAERRFRSEVELLGRLRHPGIAQVFDAGTCSIDGRRVPYLVMEYVEEAMHLCEAAERRGLDRRARLRLFADVCDAVQHGHQRGVIHRDLKPGNVLVDGEGHPKVIDFGLARALDPEGLGVSRGHTRAGEILGTLAYMSPEQIAGNLDEVDVRSDVWGLGCILCELLSGHPPFPVETLSLPEIAQSIAQADPRLPRSLPLELRWILVKALEKDPARRYASASELAADVRRWLEGEPVLAGPPGSLRRLSTLARRHRFALLAGGAVLCSLLVGLVQARREAHKAELARALAQEESSRAKSARADAERKAYLARTTSLFLTDIVLGAGRYEGGSSARVVDAIELGRRNLASISDPTARAIVGSSVGEALLSLDRREEAAPLIRSAVEQLRESLEPQDPFRLGAEVVYADLLEQEGDPESSLELSEQLLPRLEAVVQPNDPQLFYLRYNLAVCRSWRGDPKGAEELYRANLAVVRAKKDATGEVNLLGRIGTALVEEGDYDGALENFDQALELARKTPSIAALYEATTLLDRGRAWLGAGDAELALEDFLETARLYEKLEPTLSNRFALEFNLASCYLTLDRLDPAEQHAEEAERLLAGGWTSPGIRGLKVEVLRAQLDLGRGDPESAERRAREALDHAEKLLPPEAPDGPLARALLARALLAEGRAEEAADEAGRATQDLRTLEAPQPDSLARALETWARALLALGRPAEAVPHAEELLAATPADSPGRPACEQLVEQVRAAAGAKTARNP